MKMIRISFIPIVLLFFLSSCTMSEGTQVDTESGDVSSDDGGINRIENPFSGGIASDENPDDGSLTSGGEDEASPSNGSSSGSGSGSTSGSGSGSSSSSSSPSASSPSELHIITATLKDATSGKAYTSKKISAMGGVPPYTWTAQGLPQGLTLKPTLYDPDSVRIENTTDTPGVYDITLKVTDSAQASDEKTLNLTVKLVEDLKIKVSHFQSKEWNELTQENGKIAAAEIDATSRRLKLEVLREDGSMPISPRFHWSVTSEDNLGIFVPPIPAGESFQLPSAQTAYLMMWDATVAVGNAAVNLLTEEHAFENVFIQVKDDLGNQAHVNIASITQNADEGLASQFNGVRITKATVHEVVTPDDVLTHPNGREAVFTVDLAVEGGEPPYIWDYEFVTGDKPLAGGEVSFTDVDPNNFCEAGQKTCRYTFKGIDWTVNNPWVDPFRQVIFKVASKSQPKAYEYIEKTSARGKNVEAWKTLADEPPVNEDPLDEAPDGVATQKVDLTITYPTPEEEFAKDLYLYYNYDEITLLDDTSTWIICDTYTSDDPDDPERIRVNDLRHTLDHYRYESPSKPGKTGWIAFPLAEEPTTDEEGEEPAGQSHAALKIAAIKDFSLWLWHRCLAPEAANDPFCQFYDLTGLNELLFSGSTLNANSLALCSKHYCAAWQESAYKTSLSDQKDHGNLLKKGYDQYGNQQHYAYLEEIPITPFMQKGPDGEEIWRRRRDIRIGEEHSSIDAPQIGCPPAYEQYCQ